MGELFELGPSSGCEQLCLLRPCTGIVDPETLSGGVEDRPKALDRCIGETCPCRHTAGVAQLFDLRTDVADRALIVIFFTVCPFLVFDRRFLPFVLQHGCSPCDGLERIERGHELIAGRGGKRIPETGTPPIFSEVIV